MTKTKSVNETLAELVQNPRLAATSTDAPAAAPVPAAQMPVPDPAPLSRAAMTSLAQSLASPPAAVSDEIGALVTFTEVRDGRLRSGPFRIVSVTGDKARLAPVDRQSWADVIDVAGEITASRWDGLRGYW